MVGPKNSFKEARKRVFEHKLVMWKFALMGGKADTPIDAYIVKLYLHKVRRTCTRLIGWESELLRII